MQLILNYQQSAISYTVASMVRLSFICPSIRYGCIVAKL